MDFGELLHTAKKIDKSKDQRVKYYSTKFEPPKKEKKTGQLSDNIKKFLAKKQAEEQKKALEERQKRDELLALRSQDKKATKRVNVMLKRTKSANQSVIEDAVDNDNTAVTLAGPMQPDEDDYGYVSQEASQFYTKMMEKYSKMPEEPKFDMSKKKVSTNLGSTKDRVRAALEREKEEAMLPHKRKRKHKDKEEDEEGVSYGAPERIAEEKSKDDRSDKEKMPPPKPKPKVAAPPPMNFADLLKIAEKKQFEPIKIEKKEKEDERLLTKKQRREMERERESQMRREERRRHILSNGKIPKAGAKTEEKDKEKERPPEKTSMKIPKISDSSKSISSNSKVDGEKSSTKLSSGKDKDKEKPSGSKSSSKISSKVKVEITEDENYIPGKYLPGDMRYRPELENKKPPTSDLNSKKRIENNQKPPIKPTTDRKPLPTNSQYQQQQPQQYRKSSTMDVKDRDSSYNNNKSQHQSTSSPKVPQKKPSMEPQAKKFPPEDVRRKPPVKLPPKQFPLPDIQRRDERLGMGSSRKGLPVKRGRILDDDDSEYDSEMDDFIDDDDVGDDYSKYISEIFGYDKSRYKDIDEDDANMETTFAQQMKEEVISTKIGIMEDLEEERKEDEARRKKLIMKKKMRS